MFLYYDKYIISQLNVIAITGHTTGHNFQVAIVTWLNSIHYYFDCICQKALFKNFIKLDNFK